MQLLHLKIENLRSIQSLDLDLSISPDTPRRRLVLLGANGAGKSTVLNAVAHAFQVVGSDTKDLGAAELTAGDVRSVGEPELEVDAPPRRGLIDLQGWLSPEERRSTERFSDRCCLSRLRRPPRLCVVFLDTVKGSKL